MSLTRSVVVLAAAVALSACAGGGGGGGSGPVVTPPVVTPPPATPPKAPTPSATPYASNCATAPNALTCSKGSIGTGEFTIQQMQADQGGFKFTYAVLNNLKTPQTDDDQYTLANDAGAGIIYRYYETPTAKIDGLGRTRVGANYGRDGITGGHLPGDGSSLTLYDIANVLQGGLDYVQLGSLSTAGATGAPSYFVMGQGFQQPRLPTTGTATFDGGARGSYVTAAGAVYSTLSNLTLTADFAAASVNGSASNFYVLDPAGAAAFAPKELGFTFTGAIENNAVFGPRFSGAATGTGATGTVSGAFYGERGQTPAEVGMNYKLTDTAGGTLVGVGGLKRNP